MAKKTSVTLGKGNNFGFVSTNERFYPNKDPNEAMQKPNKDFITSIKASHFDIGDRRPKSSVQVRGHYLSEANIKFNSKGDASLVRA